MTKEKIKILKSETLKKTKKRIEKIIELLNSEEFKRGILNQGTIRLMIGGKPGEVKYEETIRYYYYKMYHPERFKKRYGYKIKLSTVAL